MWDEPKIWPGVRLNISVIQSRDNSGSRSTGAPMTMRFSGAAEQMLYDQYRPPLNRIRPISPRHPRLQEYLEAAKRLEERMR